MRLFSFDVETELGEPYQPGIAAPPLVCSIVGEGATGQVRIYTALETRQWFRWALEQPDIHLVGKSIDFDLGVMSADDLTVVDLVFAALDAGRVHDVGLREGLLDIARGAFRDEYTDETGARYSLAQLVERYLGVDIRAEKGGQSATEIHKKLDDHRRWILTEGREGEPFLGAPWRFRFAQLRGLPVAEWPREAVDYLIGDALHPLQVFEAQDRQAVELDGAQVPRPNLFEEVEHVRTAFALRLISIWGLRSDPARVEALEVEVAREDTETKAALSVPAIGIFRADGSVDKARLQELVTVAYGGNPPRTSPSAKFPEGQVATDRDTLLESGDPVLTRKGNAGKNDKRGSTYLPILRKGLRGPWCPWFNPLVATTRVSSDAQQFPKKGGVRECWVARPGAVFCSTDYEGLELRTMAQRAIWVVGYSLMADALNRGLDAHTHVAAQWRGVTYEEGSRLKKAKDLAFAAYRDVAKIFNFGKGGGMGAASMAYNARVKENIRFCVLLAGAPKCGREGHEEARIKGQVKRICSECVSISRDLGNRWLAAWPEQGELFALAGRLTSHGALADVVMPDDGFIRGSCRYSQWLNTPFQRLGAKATRRALWRISREMHTDRRSPLWGHHAVLQVHDEIVSELRESTAPEAADRQAAIMVEELQQVCPDLAPAAKVEPALSRFLSKSADTVRDATGRLLVWEPKAA